MKSPDLQTVAIHQELEDALMNHSITPPIYLTSTFPRDNTGQYPHGYSYGRGGNPNRRALEEALAKLEGGDLAFAFASGAAATWAVFQSLAAGDHVLVPRLCYHGTHTILREIFPRWGLSWEAVDMSSLSQVENAITPSTRLIWIETPANPTLDITNIQEITKIAKKNGIVCVADNTLATSILQKPLDLGCDLVVYSTTKYISGHSDVIGGAVVAKANSEFTNRIRTIQIHGGAIPSPFDCWLILRGIKTLPLRIRAQSETASRIATHLSQNHKNLNVYHPSLPSHPNHHIARMQMSAFGGLLSFEVPGGKEEALRIVQKTKIIRRATSFGGVESLIEHRASIEGPDSFVPQGLIRLSVGLESVQDLISDLSQALVQSSHF